MGKNNGVLVICGLLVTLWLVLYEHSRRKVGKREGNAWRNEILPMADNDKANVTFIIGGEKLNAWKDNKSYTDSYNNTTHVIIRLHYKDQINKPIISGTTLEEGQWDNDEFKRLYWPTYRPIIEKYLKGPFKGIYDLSDKRIVFYRAFGGLNSQKGNQVTLDWIEAKIGGNYKTQDLVDLFSCIHTKGYGNTELECKQNQQEPTTNAATQGQATPIPEITCDDFIVVYNKYDGRDGVHENADTLIHFQDLIGKTDYYQDLWKDRWIDGVYVLIKKDALKYFIFNRHKDRYDEKKGILDYQQDSFKDFFNYKTNDQKDTLGYFIVLTQDIPQIGKIGNNQLFNDKFSHLKASTRDKMEEHFEYFMYFSAIETEDNKSKSAIATKYQEMRGKLPGGCTEPDGLFEDNTWFSTENNEPATNAEPPSLDGWCTWFENGSRGPPITGGIQAAVEQAQVFKPVSEYQWVAKCADDTDKLNWCQWNDNAVLDHIKDDKRDEMLAKFKDTDLFIARCIDNNQRYPEETAPAPTATTLDWTCGEKKEFDIQVLIRYKSIFDQNEPDEFTDFKDLRSFEVNKDNDELEPLNDIKEKLVVELLIVHRNVCKEGRVNLLFQEFIKRTKNTEVILLRSGCNDSIDFTDAYDMINNKGNDKIYASNNDGDKLRKMVDALKNQDSVKMIEYQLFTPSDGDSDSDKRTDSELASSIKNVYMNYIDKCKKTDYTVPSIVTTVNTPTVQPPTPIITPPVWTYSWTHNWEKDGPCFIDKNNGRCLQRMKNNPECKTNIGISVTDGTSKQKCGEYNEYKNVDCDTCPSTPEPTSESTPKPIEYKWQLGSDWSTCSKPCGEGTQTKEVKCMDSNGNRASNEKCTGPAPSTQQSCKIQDCPTCTYNIIDCNGNMNIDDIGKIKGSLTLNPNQPDCTIDYTKFNDYVDSKGEYITKDNFSKEDENKKQLEVWCRGSHTWNVGSDGNGIECEAKTLGTENNYPCTNSDTKYERTYKGTIPSDLPPNVNINSKSFDDKVPCSDVDYDDCNDIIKCAFTDYITVGNSVVYAEFHKKEERKDVAGYWNMNNELVRALRTKDVGDVFEENYLKGNKLIGMICLNVKITNAVPDKIGDYDKCKKFWGDDEERLANIFTNQHGVLKITKEQDGSYTFTDNLENVKNKVKQFIDSSQTPNKLDYVYEDQYALVPELKYVEIEKEPKCTQCKSLTHYESMPDTLRCLYKNIGSDMINFGVDDGNKKKEYWKEHVRCAKMWGFDFTPADKGRDYCNGILEPGGMSIK